MFRWLFLMTVLAISPSAPLVTLSSPGDGVVWPGDAWGATATIAAPESGVYELAFYGETPGLTIVASEQGGAPAFCPELGYCRMALAAGEQVTIAAHYQAAPILDGAPLSFRVWGAAPGSAETHTTERPSARSVALPFIGGP